MNKEAVRNRLLLRAWETAVSNSRDMVFVKDSSYCYIAASPAFLDMVGLSSPEDIIGKTDRDLFDEALAERYHADDVLVMERGLRMQDNLEPLPPKKGESRYTSTSKFCITDEAGNALGIYGISRDMTEQMALAEDRDRLMAQVATDALTGVRSRESILEEIQAYLEGAGRDGRHALLFLDLDFFKEVNDQLGHPVGDKLLEEAGGTLRRLFRGSDLVGRVGGDEFLVLLKDIPSEEAALRKARELLDAMPLYASERGVQLSVTCSVGVSMFEQGAPAFPQLYAAADAAMYAAKRQGKNSAVLL